MKRLALSCFGLFASAFVALSQVPPPIPPPLPPKPPVVIAPPPPTSAGVYAYEQKPVEGQPMLVPAEQAQNIIDKFKRTYGKLNHPRILIHAAHTNSLADRETIRDVERLFGRPLRAAGATLADQSVAAQFIGAKPIKQFMANPQGEQARKDREALKKTIDVVLEFFISSRDLTVAEVSGDNVYSVPDIEATAVRLSDAKIIGQASSSDLLGKGTGNSARNYDVRDVAEATALALMDDIASHAK